MGNNDDKFNIMLERQLEVVKNLAEINQTLKFQARQLEEHIKRTELLEQRMIPVEDHVKFINTLIKTITFLAGSGGFIAGLLKLLGKI